MGCQSSCWQNRMRLYKQVRSLHQLPVAAYLNLIELFRIVTGLGGMIELSYCLVWFAVRRQKLGLHAPSSDRSKLKDNSNLTGLRQRNAKRVGDAVLLQKVNEQGSKAEEAAAGEQTLQDAGKKANNKQLASSTVTLLSFLVNVAQVIMAFVLPPSKERQMAFGAVGMLLHTINSVLAIKDLR